MNYKHFLSMEPLGKSSKHIQLTHKDGSILCFPADPANTDYQAYLKWLEEGNTPEPADEVQ